MLSRADCATVSFLIPTYTLSSHIAVLFAGEIKINFKLIAAYSRETQATVRGRPLCPQRGSANQQGVMEMDQQRQAGCQKKKKKEMKRKGNHSGRGFYTSVPEGNFHKHDAQMTHMYV